MCYGMPKSGSTLAFRLTQAVLAGAGIAQPRAPEPQGNFLPDTDPERLARLRAWAGATGVAVLALKTHAAPSEAVAAGVAEGWILAQAVARDPRDIALSMRDAGAEGRDWGSLPTGPIRDPWQAVPRIARMIRRHRAWTRLPGTLALSFEPLAFDTAAQVARIAAHLDLPCDPGRIARLAQGPGTHRNRGISQRHRAEMTAEDQARWAARFGPFIAAHCPAAAPPPGGLRAWVRRWWG